jgi:microcin C transport system ATP-binding protein
MKQVCPEPANVALIAPNAKKILLGDSIRVEFKTHGRLFRHKRFAAVADVSLELARGETLGIVGESGSGKTTLGMALLALQPLTSSEVKLDGVRIDNAGRTLLARTRKRIQVVFQDPFAALSPRRTIEQSVCEGPGAALARARRRGAAHTHQRDAG